MPAFRLAEAVELTQLDLRALQNAKGAIAAGVQLLLADAGLQAQQLDEILLTGSFGTYIDPASAQAIGLVPPVGSERVIAAGNSSLEGRRWRSSLSVRSSWPTDSPRRSNTWSSPAARISTRPSQIRWRFPFLGPSHEPEAVAARRHPRGLWDPLRQFEYSDPSRRAAEIAWLLGLRLEVENAALLEPTYRLCGVVEDEHDRRGTWTCNS